MDIFESLENLPVSESCFEDIIGLVEKYINEFDSLDNASHIKRVHGEPEYRQDGKGSFVRDENGFRIPSNKAAELFQKGHPLDGRMLHGDGYLGQGSGTGISKRDNNLIDKDLSKSVDKSISRHDKKQEKMKLPLRTT